jgi:hypothetical protein
MCASCLSNGEFVAMNAALVVGALSRGASMVRAPDPGARRAARDVRTVAFLRRLDLDPVAVLGAGIVEAADRFAASGATLGRGGAPSGLAALYARVRCAAGAMRSQRVLSAQ